ncbi:hypothetical protein, partial [Enterococcus faecalis]|uniref:hypothetical protein n=1 Tax=Enterococcus faecalis TaxID=1351 RepID=UPI00403F8C81
YDQTLRVTFDVVEAFNAGATNTVSLGYSGNANLINALPVAATGAGDVAPGSAYAGSELGRSIQSQFTLAKDLVLTFNGTGTAPSAGKVV